MYSSIQNWLFHEDQEDFERFKKGLRKPKVQLPVGFAQKIFDLELLCEEPDIDEDIVNQLLELYKIGTEYYEVQNSDKYLIFMRKQQQLLMKHNIQQAIYKPPQDAKQLVHAFQQEASIIKTLHSKDLDNQTREIDRRLKIRLCKQS